MNAEPTCSPFAELMICDDVKPVGLRSVWVPITASQMKAWSLPPVKGPDADPALTPEKDENSCDESICWPVTIVALYWARDKVARQAKVNEETKCFWRVSLTRVPRPSKSE